MYISVYALSLPGCHTVTLLFRHVPPLPLCFCLQPSRRPSLQPTFSMDCVSAPSHLHCHQKQCFASQLSLCTGNPHPHLPTYPLNLSSLKRLQHFSSSPSPQPESPPQNSTYYSSSLSPRNPELNSEFKSYSSLLVQDQTVFFPLHTHLDSLSSSSCPRKTNPPTNSHLLPSSHSKSNNTHFHPRHFSPFLSQSSPNFNSLPFSTSDVCPHTLHSIQPESNFDLKTLQLHRNSSSHTHRQTNRSTPLQLHSDAQTCHPAVQSCEKSPLPPLAPHTVASACNLSSTHLHPSSQMHNLPITTHVPFSILCSERPKSTPLKAGGVLLNYTKAFSTNRNKCECTYLKKEKEKRCNSPISDACWVGSVNMTSPIAQHK